MIASRGTVYLVGSGPGDPDLISVRGRRLLRQADVVLHDRLASQDLLIECRTQTRIIDVGKRPGRLSAGQNEINRLLISYAKAGRVVVRLKGGDPFVFGRGAEEQTACRRAGVQCLVVPGISSALAAPAALGVPVTFRGMSRNFAVVTGCSNGTGSPPDYKVLASLDTVVFLMAFSELPAICNSLLKAGKPGDTPAVCIERATTPDQKAVTGELRNIASRVNRAGLQAPVVTIVGPVASFARISDLYSSEEVPKNTPKVVSPSIGRRASHA